MTVAPVAFGNGIPFHHFRNDALTIDGLRLQHGDAFLLLHAPDDGSPWSPDATTGAGVAKDGNARRTSPLPSMLVFVVQQKSDSNVDWVGVGRNATNDVHIPHPSVSRFHAKLRALGGGITLEDARSANGTFIGGRALLPETPTPLAVGDVVRFGELDAMFANATRLLDIVRSAQGNRR